MKKFILSILAVIILVSLAGCGNLDSNKSDSNVGNESVATTKKITAQEYINTWNQSLTIKEWDADFPHYKIWNNKLDLNSADIYNETNTKKYDLPLITTPFGDETCFLILTTNNNETIRAVQIEMNASVSNLEIEECAAVFAKTVGILIDDKSPYDTSYEIIEKLWNQTPNSNDMKIYDYKDIRLGVNITDDETLIFTAGFTK